MTETTGKRQITKLVNGIFTKFGIDNLACEMVLTDAFWRYVTERKTGKSIAEIRADILRDLEISGEKKAKNDEMESRIFQATGLYVNDKWYLDGIIDFLQKHDALGETIETFAERCKADPYNMPKFFQIAQKPTLLRDTWGLAFIAPSTKQDETPADRMFRKIGI